MGQIAALQLSCRCQLVSIRVRGQQQRRYKHQAPRLSLNADPSCWQADGSNKSINCKQAAGQQPFTQHTAGDSKCGVPSLSFIDGLPAASRYLVWGMEVFFIRPNFQL